MRWALLGALSAAAVVAAVLGPGLLPGGSVTSPGHPPLPAGVSSVPLGTPAPPPAGEGGFAVLDTDAGEPVRWDPCRPIRYVVDDRAAPPGADYLLTSALAEVQRVTGFVLVREGTTDEVPSDDRRPVQRQRYGDRWAPVLVAWSDPSAHPRLAGDVAAYAGPRAVDGAGPGTRRYVTGQLVIDSPQVGEAAAGPAGLARTRAVLLHELGHLLGLDHVEDRSQLMFPSTTPLVTDFADGDLRGLAAVSGGPCRTDF